MLIIRQASLKDPYAPSPRQTAVFLEGFDVFISAEMRNLWEKVGNDKLLSCFEPQH